VGPVIGHAKLRMDQVRDAAAGPDRSAKAEGFCSLRKQTNEVRVLVWRQQGGRARRRVVAQRCDPLGGGAFEPLADGALGDAQSFSDVLLGPSLQVQVPGTETAAFLPTPRLLKIWCAHDLRAQHIPAHGY
jgi:hypothetical protein